MIFCVFFSFSTFGHPSDDLICYSSTYAPYSFPKNNQPIGIDIDIVQVISERINVPITYKIIPWSRLKQNIRAGKISCAMAFLKNDEYTNGMAFMSNPITVGEHAIFIEKKNKDKFKKLDDFFGFTIAVNRGFKAPDAFNEAVAKARIKKYDVGDDVQSLQMLSASRVDGVLTDKHVGLYNLQQLRIDNITSLNEPLASTAVFLIFSKELKDSGLVEKFDQALLNMHQDGTYQRILDKYLLETKS